ncbi:MAG TPA: FecR family protein [Patescibacteria group bacterium]|nr:FecR family protein [Patescibacteria group bacterium]
MKIDRHEDNVMHTVRPRSVIFGLVGLLVLAAWGSAQAQMQPASAELVRATGRVDLMPKGQTAWTPGSVGARLVEGDQIRALAGGSADLVLPDGSTILIAENSRFAVTKLDYDVANRDRDASFHVVAGKVRAQVSQAAVTVIRARQSNFNISTPSGVAAVRGTIVVLAYNPSTQETLTFVFPSPGQSAAAARVTFVNKNGQAVTVTGGNFVRQVGNNPPGQPTPIGTLPTAVQTALTTASNTSTQGSTELVVVSVPLPTPQETQNTANSGGAGTGTGTPGTVQVSNPAPPTGPPDYSGSGDPNCAAGTGVNCKGSPPPNICPRGQFGTPPNCSTCMSPPCE